MTIAQAHKDIVARLASHTGEARAEAGEILSHVLGCGGGELLLRFSEDMPTCPELETIVQQRITGRPLAYVLGHKYFYGYKFYVDERVLIPRWDSECVVHKAIQLVARHGYATVLDLCCGSGCLGLTLLLETGVMCVDFVDISRDALDVTRQNAEMLLLENKTLALPGTYLGFVESDMLDNIDGAYDIIVCNPPYVSPAEYERLDAQIRIHEPKQALVAEQDGHLFYERLIPRAQEHLNAGGALVLEVGSTQDVHVAGLLARAGFVDIQCGEDIAGRPRYVSAQTAPDSPKFRNPSSATLQKSR